MLSGFCFKVGAISREHDTDDIEADDHGSEQEPHRYKGS